MSSLPARPADALLRSTAFHIHFHRLTSTPVCLYIFSLEILSFLSPFTPSVDTIPRACVCVWVRSSWHTQEVNTFTSPEIADSGRGGRGWVGWRRWGDTDSKDPHPDSTAAGKPILALGDSARRYRCTAIPSPRLPSPRPRRACCDRGNNGSGGVPGTKTTAALPGRALQPPRTMAMCNPIPPPASE